MRSKTTNGSDMRPKVQMSCFPCRHFKNNRTVIPKICIYNYECWKCAFDQWLDELDTRQEMLTAAA